MMKRMMMTAAALMFSTSALAWAPAQDKTPGGTMETAKSAGTMSMKSAAGMMVTATGMKSGMAKAGNAKVPNDMDMAWSGDEMDSGMKLASAKVPNDMDTTWSGDEMGGGMKLASAKVPNDMDAMWNSGDMTWSGEKMAGDMASAKLASYDTSMAGGMDDMTRLDMAMADEGAGSAMSWSGKGEATMASADSGQWTGQGGPYEEEVQAYPACRPGPGDDRCIQLYETGGRKNLMASNGATMNSQLAMGGPYEPVPAAGGKTETAATAEDHSAHAPAGAAAAKPTADEGADDPNFQEDTATPPAGKPDMAEATGGGTPKMSK